MPANRPYVIGLTGGMGCGKSEAAKYLESLGAARFDADEVSRALTAPGGDALPAIREKFGDSVFNADGTLNAAIGTKPDVPCKPGETPLQACLRAMAASD